MSDEQIKSEPRIVWCAQEDGNFQDEKCDAIDECIDDGGGVGSIIYFGEAVEHDPRKFLTVDELLDFLGDRAWDYGGEYADDYPNVTPEAKAELEAFWNAWLLKNANPTFYSVEKVTQYVLTDVDIS